MLFSQPTMDSVFADYTEFYKINYAFVHEKEYLINFLKHIAQITRYYVNFIMPQSTTHVPQMSNFYNRFKKTIPINENLPFTDEIDASWLKIEKYMSTKVTLQKNSNIPSWNFNRIA